MQVVLSDKCPEISHTIIVLIGFGGTKVKLTLFI